MSVQYLDTDAGRLVVLPEADYLRLAEAFADAEAGAVIDQFQQKLAKGEEELVPATVVKRLLAGEVPLRVWRDYRGLKVGELAAHAGLSQAYVSQLETGKREGSLAAMKALANVLSVTVDDLI